MSTKRKKSTHRRRSGMARPTTRKVPIRSFTSTYQKKGSRRDVELVPSAVENEVVAQWQEFAEARGFRVEENLRVPNISDFNEEIPWELSFAMPQPSDSKESQLWSEFVASARDGIRVEVGGRVYIAHSTTIYFFVQPPYTGWWVEDEQGNVVKPADLDWCRGWAEDINDSRIWRIS